ncbi:hypothetical protein GGR57DRAFT_488656 [Xylariaceae sp. FL1272]|nr:hypothetical protein GGR57DRAFT_488656 [Xylariaceae sp. FL1272]
MFLSRSQVYLGLLSLAELAVAAPRNTSRTPQWKPLANLPRARQEHGIAAIDNNTIAIVAGVFSDSPGVVATTSSLQLYDIPSNTWRNATSVPFSVNHPNVVAVDGLLYVLGGLVDAPVLPPGTTIDWIASGESHVYDAATDSWTQLTSMPSGTERGSAIVGVYGDLIYLAGGMTVLSDAYQDSLTLVTAYNITSDEWVRLPAIAANIPEGRQHGVGAVIGDELYVIGGRWFGQKNVRDTAFVLDLNDLAKGWITNEERMPTARGGLSGAVVGDQFYTFGGEGDPNTTTGVFPQTEVLDTKSGVWTKLAPMAVPRHGTQAVAVGNGIYIPGGGLQQDGLAVTVDGVTTYGNTSDTFDVLIV